MLTLDADYFSNTDCLLLLACSTASKEDGTVNNMAKAFKHKGVETVVAFEGQISSAWSSDGIMTTTLGSGLWGKIFVRELGNGATVKSAKETAFDEMLKKQLKHFGKKESDIEDLLESKPEYVNKYLYCGMNTCTILGDENHVVRH